MPKINANGDITVPASIDDEDYETQAEKWRGPRLIAANAAGEKIGNKKPYEMELNASLGVIEREGEYPLTLNEYEALFAQTGWTIDQKVIVLPYNDVVYNCIKS